MQRRGNRFVWRVQQQQQQVGLQATTSRGLFFNGKTMEGEICHILGVWPINADDNQSIHLTVCAETGAQLLLSALRRQAVPPRTRMQSNVSIWCQNAQILLKPGQLTNMSRSVAKQKQTVVYLVCVFVCVLGGGGGVWIWTHVLKPEKSHIDTEQEKRSVLQVRG